MVRQIDFVTHVCPCLYGYDTCALQKGTSTGVRSSTGQWITSTRTTGTVAGSTHCCMYSVFMNTHEHIHVFIAFLKYKYSELYGWIQPLGTPTINCVELAQSYWRHSIGCSSGILLAHQNNTINITQNFELLTMMIKWGFHHLPILISPASFCISSIKQVTKALAKKGRADRP